MTRFSFTMMLMMIITDIDMPGNGTHLRVEVNGLNLNSERCPHFVRTPAPCGALAHNLPHGARPHGVALLDEIEGVPHVLGLLRHHRDLPRPVLLQGPVHQLHDDLELPALKHCQTQYICRYSPLSTSTDRQHTD